MASRLDPFSAQRVGLVHAWANPVFAGANGFLYEPVHYNRANFFGPAVQWRPDPQFGLVAVFALANYALAENPGALFPLSEITVCGWVNATSLPAGGTTILGLSDITVGGNIQLGFALGTLFCNIGATAAALVSPVLGQWHNFAGTCDATGLVSVYFDGALVGTQSGGGVVFPMSIAPALGGTNADGSVIAQFDGRLYDVRIYDRALRADEIRNVADSELSKTLFTPGFVPAPPIPPIPPPVNPLLGQPPFYRAIIRGESYTSAETSPLIFEQLYNERWETVSVSNPLIARLSKSIAGVTTVIDRDAIFGTIAGAPALWFEMPATVTAAMELGEWKGELRGASNTGAITEVFRKFALFVRG
jgi:hypothetical protein